MIPPEPQFYHSPGSISNSAIIVHLWSGCASPEDHLGAPCERLCILGILSEADFGGKLNGLEEKKFSLLSVGKAWVGPIPGLCHISEHHPQAGSLPSLPQPPAVGKPVFSPPGWALGPGPVSTHKAELMLEENA